MSIATVVSGFHPLAQFKAELKALWPDRPKPQPQPPIDETETVQKQHLYDYKNDRWLPQNFAKHPQVPPRFIGLNQPGGPQVPPEALANPDQYTYIATQENIDSQRRGLNYWLGKLMRPLDTKFFGGGGPDEVPPMPKEMVGKLESYLQPGDVFLQGNHPSDRFSKNRSMFGHAGIYLGNGYVVQSIGMDRKLTNGMILHPGVDIVRFEDSFVRDLDTGDRVCVLRPKNMTQENFNKMAQEAISKVGVPYDFAMNSHDDNRVYCTEFVRDLYRDIAPHIKPDVPLIDAIYGPAFIKAAQAGDFDIELILNPKTKSEHMQHPWWQFWK